MPEKPDDTPPATTATKPEEVAPEMDWRELAYEDWVVLVIFWVLAAIVFAQFFTRYALNAPLAWTEELARYLLILVGFLGSVIAVRKNTHIFIEVLYHFLPKPVSKGLVALVDVIRTVFFIVATKLSWQVTEMMTTQYMSVLRLPLSYVYGVVTVAFALMVLRSIQVSWRHYKEGYAMIDRLRQTDGAPDTRQSDSGHGTGSAP